MIARELGLFQEAWDLFSDIFSTQYWPARWHCGKWTDFHGWFYIISELMIWAAYFAIPILLFNIVTKRSDLPFPRVFVLFSAFILLCGSTHLMDAVIFWWPAYRFSALLKFATGVVSLFTVYALYKTLPLILSLRTAKELEVEAEHRRKAERQFLDAFNFSPIGMALVSLDGKWLKVNSALVNALGYSKEDFSDLTFQDITHPEDLQVDLENLELLLKGEIQSYQMEKRYLKKNGTISWALLAVSLVRDDKGAPEYFIAQITDINNSKNLNNAMELMKKKDEFMTIAAHELKTPITSVKGALQILESHFKKTDSDKATAPFVQIANKQIVKLTWIVNDLLDVTKIQGGKLSLNISTFSAKDLVNDALEQVHYQRAGKNIICEGVGQEIIQGDKIRLEQVLVNLITNAIKYSPGQPDILIDTKQINNYLVISVQDFGIGIDPEKIPRLFERFFRVENTSQNFSGLGMGLYISEQMMKLHGGGIEVKSTLGEGSVFSLKIPITRNLNQN